MCLNEYYTKVNQDLLFPPITIEITLTITLLASTPVDDNNTFKLYVAVYAVYHFKFKWTCDWLSFGLSLIRKKCI